MREERILERQSVRDAIRDEDDVMCFFFLILRLRQEDDRWADDPSHSFIGTDCVVQSFTNTEKDGAKENQLSKFLIWKSKLECEKYKNFLKELQDVRQFSERWQQKKAKVDRNYADFGVLN